MLKWKQVENNKAYMKKLIDLKNASKKVSPSPLMSLGFLTDKTYVLKEGEGYFSHHFDENRPYIDLRKIRLSLKFDNKKPLPEEQEFEKWSWNESTRTF